MATKNNDKTILALKKQIEEKKKALKLSERFSPVTNCSIEIDGQRYNLQVLTKEQLVSLLVRLNAYRNSAKELNLLDDFVISGYNVESWIDDIQSKMMLVNRKAEEAKLKAMEDRLTQLLSNEKKVELEINDIASMLG